MYRKCTTEKASAQQRQFQNALLQSMLQIPYGEITVTGLCTQTGLSRKTFYRLFENKDDVLNALIDHTLQEMDACLRHDAVYAELVRVFRYWKEKKALLDAVSRNNKTVLLLERALLLTTFEDRQMLQAMDAVDDPHQQQIVLFLLCGIMGQIIYWHHTGFGFSEEEMAALSTRLLVYPPLRVLNPEENI